MGVFLITLGEICQGLSVLTARRRKLGEHCRFISMLFMSAYIGVTYGFVYFIASLVIALACAIMSKDIIYILSVVACFSCYLLSYVVVITTITRVEVSNILLLLICTSMLLGLIGDKKK